MWLRLGWLCGLALENLLFEQSHTVLKMRIALTGEIGMAAPVLPEGGLQIIWSHEETA
jgi:hypothetical protein